MFHDGSNGGRGDVCTCGRACIEHDDIDMPLGRAEAVRLVALLAGVTLGMGVGIAIGFAAIDALPNWGLFGLVLGFVVAVLVSRRRELDGLEDAG